MPKLKIADLVLDYELYPRNDVSSTQVKSLCDSATAGYPIPAIIVDRKSKRVVDGFHRVAMGKRLGWEEIDCVEKDYKSEVELFADAVRLNRTHGRPLDPYDIRRAVGRLRNFGMKAEAISEVVRMPAARIVEVVRDFGISRSSGDEVPLKTSVLQFAGSKLSKTQEAANDAFSGMEFTYHVKQLLLALKSGMWKDTPGFRAGMDELTELWKGARKKEAS